MINNDNALSLSIIPIGVLFLAMAQRKLTQKEQIAVNHFLANGSKTEAYKAGYSCKNMKPASINRAAFGLFERPPVKAEVDRMNEEARKNAIMSREEALGILSQIGRGKITNYLTEDGEIDVSKVASQGGSDVEELTVTETEGESFSRSQRKLKVRNPVQAIERLAKLEGWDKQNQLNIEGITFNINTGEND